jgi:hypothetical protein
MNDFYSTSISQKAESPPETGEPASLKVYLAARYSRRRELCEYAAYLAAFGHSITSRWLEGNHQISDDGLSAEAKAEERTRFALEDWADLMAADLCINFTEPPRGTNSRGGRHVEFGAALASGKRVIVVGHRENVFHCLPQVEFYATWEDCFAVLRQLLQDTTPPALPDLLPEDTDAIIQTRQR